MSLPNGNNATGYFCRQVANTAAKTGLTLVTPPSGMRAVVTSISAWCDGTNAVPVAVTVAFGSVAVVAAAVVDGIPFFHPGIAAGHGAVVGNGSGIVGYGEKDEAVLYSVTVPTSGEVSLCVVGYFAEAQQVAT